MVCHDEVLERGRGYWNATDFVCLCFFVVIPVIFARVALSILRREQEIERGGCFRSCLNREGIGKLLLFRFIKLLLHLCSTRRKTVSQKVCVCVDVLVQRKG